MNDIKELITSVLKNTTYNNVNVYELSKKIYDVLSNHVENFKNRLSEENVFQILSSIIEENKLNTTKEKTLSPVDQLINEYQDVRINPLIGNPVIDLYSEMKNELLSGYRDVGDVISSCKIVISNPEIMKYAGDLMSIINEGNSKIYRSIAVIADNIVSSFNDIENLDLEINDVDLDDWDFNDWYKIRGKIKTDELKFINYNDDPDAVKYFFEEICNCTIKGNRAILDGYEYDFKNRELYYPGSNSKVYMELSVPVDKDKNFFSKEYYSKLNTLTLLSGKQIGGDPNQDDRKKNNLIKNDGKDDIADYSNAIIVALGEGPYQSSAYNEQMKNNITATTNFINKLVESNLDRCQNIIAGGSQCGAKCLRVAANSNDLYRSVICVNNAAIVNDVNSNGTSKEKFKSLDELSGLDGKNIYMISTKKDGNLTMNDSSYSLYDDKKDITKGFVYTGLMLMIDKCPNANIYFISNNEKEEFRSIKAENYTYLSEKWNDVAPSYEDVLNSTNDHAQYHKILSDLCSSNLVGYNGYSNMQDDINYKAENYNNNSNV